MSTETTERNGTTITPDLPDPLLRLSRKPYTAKIVRTHDSLTSDIHIELDKIPGAELLVPEAIWTAIRKADAEPQTFSKTYNDRVCVQITLDPTDITDTTYDLDDIAGHPDVAAAKEILSMTGDALVHIEKDGTWITAGLFRRITKSPYQVVNIHDHSSQPDDHLTVYLDSVTDGDGVNWMALSEMIDSE